MKAVAGGVGPRVHGCVTPGSDPGNVAFELIRARAQFVTDTSANPLTELLADYTEPLESSPEWYKWDIFEQLGVKFR